MHQPTSEQTRGALMLSSYIQSQLACPYEHAAMVPSDDNRSLICGTCGRRFPIVDGIPILINDQLSAFRIADYVQSRAISSESAMAPAPPRKMRLRRLLGALTPNLSIRSSHFDAADALRHVAGSVAQPHILVVGCGDVAFSGDGNPDVIYTDVQLSQTTQIVCDAHSLPFQDESFDAVVGVAVLEHVADARRCVDEIFRVLKPDGFVYAETPFMQQVHLGAYDFARFTATGHRRLFRQFSEIKSGIVGGPAMALAWSFEYFLASFSEKELTRKILRSIARLVAFPIKYLDRFLVGKRGAIDCASSFYFFGRKSSTVLSDREIVEGYRGLNPK
jgi:SAM-dependent methyltransferase